MDTANLAALSKISIQHVILISLHLLGLFGFAIASNQHQHQPGVRTLYNYKFLYSYWHFTRLYF